MKKYKYYILIFAFSIIYINILKAQNDTIFKALKDEIDRNITQLREEKEYPVPFFIEYGLNDISYNVLSGTLGSITRLKSNVIRNNSVRVMVGDYELSDENFKDKTSNSRYNDGNIPLPLENDYLSLRRSYWITTNNVFKNATELYRNKISAMKLKELSKEDLPATDLSREMPVIIKKPPLTDDFNKEDAIETVNILSGEFTNYPEIHFSQVSLYNINALRYMVNSEGSTISIPFNFYVLYIGAMRPDCDNHMMWNQLVYYFSSFDKFPGKTTILDDIQIFVENMNKEANAEKYDEKYIGPVMYEDFGLVEHIFLRLFGAAGESLIANRSPLINDKKEGLILPNIQTWEQRIGKRVIDSKLSIYDISPKKKYKNNHLIGSFQIDVQAVKPKDTLTLVKNGILKAQLTSRTPTSKQDKSTGHFRIGTSENNVLFMLAPGVVQIKPNETIERSELKSKLIEMGKNEGLDYVFCVRSLSTSANNNPVSFYKISVENGQETLIRGVKNSFSIDDIRDITYISDKEKIFNTLFFRGGLGYTRGVPVSFISPDALIVKETHINGDINTLKGELPVVPSPLMEFNKK